MGKKNKGAETVTDETPSTGRKTIVLTLADGTEEKRVDYIRRRADEGTKRSEIAKELSALQGKTVPYQIVFAATKDHPAYKKNEAAVDDIANEDEDENEGGFDDAV